MKNEPHQPPEPQADRYRPLSARRRLLIVLLAIATTLVVAWLMLERPGGAKRMRMLPQTCRAGQDEGCVGGKAEVIVVPPSAASR